jgi:hypothetical protein
MSGNRWAGAAWAAAWVAVLIVPGWAWAADTAGGLYEQAMAADRRMDDGLAAVRTADDVPTATAAAEAAAKELDDLTAKVAALPRYTTDDLTTLFGRIHPDLQAELDRHGAAARHVRRFTRDGGPLAEAIDRAGVARKRFGDAVGAAAIQSPPPPPPPHVPITRVEIRGVRDRRLGIFDDKRWSILIQHLQKGGDGLGVIIGDDGADPNVSYVIYKPWPDVDAMAKRVDFGTVTVDEAARTIVVDADPAKVDAIVKAYVPPPPVLTPPAPPPPPPAGPPRFLPRVLRVGDRVTARFHGDDDDWRQGTVVSRLGRRYKIHFDGQPDSDDQMLGHEALMPPEAAK